MQSMMSETLLFTWLVGHRDFISQRSISYWSVPCCHVSSLYILQTTCHVSAKSASGTGSKLPLSIHLYVY